MLLTVRIWKLQERLHRGEWAAVALAGLGTIGVGATSGEEAPKQAARPHEPSVLRILVVLALMCGLVAALSLARVLTQQQRAAGDASKRGAPGRPAKPSASAYGLQVGRDKSFWHESGMHGTLNNCSHCL